MRFIISVPSAGIRTSASTASEVYDVLTDYLDTGYAFDLIEFE